MAFDGDLTVVPEERFQTFLGAMYGEIPKDLAELEARALADDVPIVRRDMQHFLMWVLRTYRPKRILELGTAVGYSAILMARTLPQATIRTVENWPPRIEAAKENFAKFSQEGQRIALMEGDALEVILDLPSDEKYDMVFLDAAKGQYPQYLPEIRRVLRPGGILITDNILQDGDILESHYAVRRRDRTIHKRMREYLYTLTHDEGLSTAIIPVGDGVALTTLLD